MLAPVDRVFSRLRRSCCLAALAALVLARPLWGNSHSNLGGGDAGLLVGLTADQRVWVIAEEQNAKTYPDFANGDNVAYLEKPDGIVMLCANHADQLASILFGSTKDVKQRCSIAAGVFRCFPLGLGRGMLQRGIISGNPVMVSWKGDVPVAATMTADQLSSLGVRPGERILGEIDGRRFYWSNTHPTVVTVRDLENKLVGEWKVPRLAIPDGVVRGLTNPKSIAVVGNFKARGLIKWGGQYEYAIVDIEGYR